jgi:hypothetical protein
MVKSLTVTNYTGDMLKCELSRPEDTGFAIIGIDGIGPVQAQINITEVTSYDGGIYNSARANSRNIVLTIFYYDIQGTTIEELRHKTYKYFPLKQRLTLDIETEFRKVTTYGYVESNEVNIFSAGEGSVISILCPDAYFYAKEVTDEVFYGIEGMFEYPFSNESLTDPLLNYSEIQHDTQRSVYYEGEQNVGIFIRVHFTAAATGLRIYSINSQTMMSFDDTKLASLVGSGFVAGDDLYVSTISGNKSAVLLRAGKTTNVLNAIVRPIPWAAFQLSKGDNIFVYTASTGEEFINFRIEYQIGYEGA